MSDHVYKIVEIVGSSTSGLEDAITTAVDRASRTLENLDWFEVAQIRGHLAEGRVAHYQVTLKIGFKLND
jgi:flavin-binding protein dodecin